MNDKKEKEIQNKKPKSFAESQILYADILEISLFNIYLILLLSKIIEPLMNFLCAIIKYKVF